jgi:dTDP-4-dehydrorhamnose 3,5-epimerase-like enzyme
MSPQSIITEKPCILLFDKIGNSTIGYVSIAENNKNIPFKIKRTYWTYYTPNEVIRGNHAHKSLNQVIVAVSGEIKFSLEDINNNKSEFILSNPWQGLFIPPYHWRTIEFSHNAVLLCLASEEYDEQDYIRSYDEFKKMNISFPSL